MSENFNPDLLRVARQARGMSQAELSQVSGLSQGNISKLENALIGPTADALEKLAAALHFPTSLFFEPDRVYGLPISVHSGARYRKRASARQRDLDRLEAEMNVRLIHVRRLLKAAEFEGELPLPKLDIDEFGGDAERIADLVRRTWLVPSGPLRNLIGLVERAGCLVLHCDFDGMPVDGVTLSAPGTPPCIFLNSSQPGDRQRFTLAHELGHIVMHQVPSKTMEDEANSFAAALLVPARDVRPYLVGGLTLRRLAELKPMWRVSMGALLYRAKAIGAIANNQSNYLWRQMSRFGYRRQEPPELELPPERPTVLPEIIRVHLDELGYEVADLASALHVYEDDLRRIHPLPSSSNGPMLRVVK